MASTRDARKESIDGWVGNPDMITDTVDSGGAPIKPTRFHSFSLSRRIFLCGFIALSIMLLGVIIVFQTQNRSLDLLRNNLLAQADFYKTHLQLRLNVLGGDQEGIDRTLETVVAHKYFDLAVFTPDGELVKANAATASQDSQAFARNGIFRMPILRLNASTQYSSIEEIQYAVFKRQKNACVDPAALKINKGLKRPS